jgi:hypothetical protein
MLARVYKTKIGLVNQGGCLEGVIGAFVLKLMLRHAAKLIV